MNSYQAHITVEQAGQLVLSGLPFKKGEKVRVVVETEQSFAARAAENKKRASELFKKVTTQLGNDPRLPNLTEAEIANEIAAYRRGE
jgi:predicted DNA-binding antitoxin AbrB/MazE fold protein